MKVTVKINPASRIMRDHGLDANGHVQRYWTSEVLRRITKYMPYRRGDFIKLTIAQTNMSKPEIISNTPYSKYLFYGYAMEGKAPKHVTDRPLKYTKSKNPKAGARWDNALKAAEYDAMRADLQAYIDRRG